MRLAPSTRTSSTVPTRSVPLGRDPLHDVDEAFDPLVLHLVRDLVRQLRRLGAARGE